jgi:hypothetical protein
MGFTGTRMSDFNWAFFFKRLEENLQKKGRTRTRATLSFYEIVGQYLTKLYYDL